MEDEREWRGEGAAAAAGESAAEDGEVPPPPAPPAPPPQRSESEVERGGACSGGRLRGREREGGRVYADYVMSRHYGTFSIKY